MQGARGGPGARRRLPPPNSLPQERHHADIGVHGAQAARPEEGEPEATEGEPEAAEAGARVSAAESEGSAMTIILETRPKVEDIVTLRLPPAPPEDFMVIEVGSNHAVLNNLQSFEVHVTIPKAARR